jgi:hypothetical protein
MWQMHERKRIVSAQVKAASCGFGRIGASGANDWFLLLKFWRVYEDYDRLRL